MKKLLITTIALLLVAPAFAVSRNDTLFTGTWKGTSICQQKNSPCNDEIDVCHIAASATPGIYAFTMNKMVDGKEVDMGILDFTYNAAEKTFTCEDKNRQTLWTFTIKNEAMEGSLMLKGKLYRIIKLHREN